MAEDEIRTFAPGPLVTPELFNDPPARTLLRLLASPDRYSTVPSE
jgi:hypothetical protein